MSLNKSIKKNEIISLYCVLSLPRSGSTVLTSQLDNIEGVVCVPENYFPCLLAFLNNWQSYSEERLAQLFIAATDDKNLLDLQDVILCINKHDMRDTYISIGLKIAERMGRPIDDVKAVVWKTTRLVSGFYILRDHGFKFILLRRNPLNVLGSQYRVKFGFHNRRPLRFVLFNYSYRSVFRRIDNNDSFRIYYSQMQNQMADLLNWMSISDKPWHQGYSAIFESMGASEWHAGLSSNFVDQDTKKLQSLNQIFRIEFFLFSILFYPFIFFLSPLRKHLDSITANKLIQRI